MIRTTVVGSQPLVGDVFRRIDRHNVILHRGNEGDTLEGVVERNIRLQENWGIDILSEGELLRHETPGQDYILYFGLGLEGVTRKDGQPLDPTIRVVDALQSARPFILPDWELSQRWTMKPVKINLPGPLSFVRRVPNFHYGDLEAFSLATARALNLEIRRLAAAGCRWVQLDDPHLVWDIDLAEKFGIGHLDIVAEGVEDINLWVHICRGNNYGFVGSTRSLDAMPYYFDVAPILSRSAVTGISVEAPFVDGGFCLEKFGEKDIVLGVIDIHDREAELVGDVEATLARALMEVPSHRLIASPNCGLRHMDVETATVKIGVMVEAVDRLNANI